MRILLASIVKTSLQPNLVRLTKLSSTAYHPLCDGLHTTEQAMILLTYMHAWRKVGTRLSREVYTITSSLKQEYTFQILRGP